jgi:hypothetical protein
MNNLLIVYVDLLSNHIIADPNNKSVAHTTKRRVEFVHTSYMRLRNPLIVYAYPLSNYIIADPNNISIACITKYAREKLSLYP